MKAILVNDDRSLSWSDVPNPVVGTDDCLVKIEYAAVNRADITFPGAGSYRNPYNRYPGMDYIPPGRTSHSSASSGSL